MEKRARADHPIHDLLARRWSPYAYSDQPVDAKKILSLLEAARWAASSFNEQPWAFIMASKENPEEHARLLGCLVEANQGWAKNAPVLMLSVGKKTFARNGKPNRTWQHDVGLAVQSLVVQAMEHELFVHQMSGIDLDKCRSAYRIPDDWEAVAGIAIGFAGDPNSMPEALKDRDLAPRQRKDLKDFVFGSGWGQPSGVLPS